VHAASDLASETPLYLNSSEQHPGDLHDTQIVDKSLPGNARPSGLANSSLEDAGTIALVLYNFVKTNDTELTLEKGKIVVLLKTDNPDWWYGVNGQDQRGWFSQRYVDKSWSSPIGTHFIQSSSDHSNVEIPFGDIQENRELNDKLAPLVPPNPPENTPVLPGNLLLDIEVPQDIVKRMKSPPQVYGTESTHIRYTAVTCTADKFLAENYPLRQAAFNPPRNTEILFMIDLTSP
jgi:hypothetical protein